MQKRMLKWYSGMPVVSLNNAKNYSFDYSNTTTYPILADLLQNADIGVDGPVEINIDTDLRLAAAAAFRKVADINRAEFDPRKFLQPAMDAMRSVCRERFEAFGTAGHADRIKVIPMALMARRYTQGELDPKTTAGKAA